MSSSTVSVAIIGAGLIGPRHAQSVVANEHATLHCFVDPRLEAILTAEAFHVPLFTSIQHMLLEYGKPDGALVCTPNHTHVALSRELLDAGVDVLVEKPISTEISTGRDLIETARRTGRHLLVGHHRRFNSYIVSAKRALSEGIIGRPIAISGLWVLRKPASYFEPPTEWRAIPGKGGPVHINLVHDLDILQYLLGPITRVHAEKSISQRRHDVEEGAAVVLRLASGVVGTFILADNCPSAHNFESGTGENPIIPQACKDFYWVFGTGGTLSVGDIKVSKYDSGAEKCWVGHVRGSELPVEACVPFDEQMKNFVDVMRGLPAPRCTGEDGLKALIVCDAIKKSIETGLPVDIAI
ncbi:hypothetical protein CERZMDRAFT_86852 [Cercospora zeae-maydis SCOH1-5]|uniref:Gfo/Idh/MocA-like oxidoreductase N-terminal domain-containing protein n=1 Tax=Cercospora zeae-maydis SCOH1-5 TaxID=717836 RepID=A0A6A6F4Z6_9PEZI|nr:hypothetical protein CERZMDRAFT_86852 [Cercospora zeae-maydis SCOH1-5]